MEAVTQSNTLNTLPELPVRKEVREFIRAAETLLSPVILGSDLTEEECELIREYVMSLSHARHSWSKGLPIRYT